MASSKETQTTGASGSEYARSVNGRNPAIHFFLAKSYCLPWGSPGRYSGDGRMSPRLLSCSVKNVRSPGSRLSGGSNDGTDLPDISAMKRLNCRFVIGSLPRQSAYSPESRHRPNENGLAGRITNVLPSGQG